MEFVTLEDETGLVECTLFPDVHARYRGVVHSLGPYVAEGRIEEQYGAPTLNVSRIALVPTTTPQVSAMRSASAENGYARAIGAW